MRKPKEPPKIGRVEFYYTGSDKQFDEFLKAVIREYVVDDKLQPDDQNESDKSA